MIAMINDLHVVSTQYKSVSYHETIAAQITRGNNIATIIVKALCHSYLYINIMSSIIYDNLCHLFYSNKCLIYIVCYGYAYALRNILWSIWLHINSLLYGTCKVASLQKQINKQWRVNLVALSIKYELICEGQSCWMGIYMTITIKPLAKKLINANNVQSV